MAKKILKKETPVKKSSTKISKKPANKSTKKASTTLTKKLTAKSEKKQQINKAVMPPKKLGSKLMKKKKQTKKNKPKEIKKAKEKTISFIDNFDYMHVVSIEGYRILSGKLSDYFFLSNLDNIYIINSKTKYSMETSNPYYMHFELVNMDSICPIDNTNSIAILQEGNIFIYEVKENDLYILFSQEDFEDSKDDFFTEPLQLKLKKTIPTQLTKNNDNSWFIFYISDNKLGILGNTLLRVLDIEKNEIYFDMKVNATGQLFGKILRYNKNLIIISEGKEKFKELTFIDISTKQKLTTLKNAYYYDARFTNYSFIETKIKNKHYLIIQDPVLIRKYDLSNFELVSTLSYQEVLEKIGVNFRYLLFSSNLIRTSNGHLLIQIRNPENNKEDKLWLVIIDEEDLNSFSIYRDKNLSEVYHLISLDDNIFAAGSGNGLYILKYD